MHDADYRLLREMLHEAYRDVNPEITDRGAHLVRKLAEGLYNRGARITIGVAQPPVHVFIHQSVNALGHIVWTCKKWNEVMGCRSHEALGCHISDFLSPDSFEYFKDFLWPELVRSGKVENVPVAFVRKNGERLPGVLKSEIMRNADGSFGRTFAKIRLTLNGFLSKVSTAALVLHVAA